MTTAIKTTKKDREALLALARTTTKIRALRAEHHDVFVKLAKYEREEKLAGDAFKELAREHAVTGETVVLFDDEVATVKVVGGESAPEYDADKAREFWSKAQLAKSMVLDRKKVIEMIGNGEMKVEVAASAEVSGKPLTPSVRIDIHGGVSGGGK